MPDDIESDLDQLSPLIDDVMQHVTRLPRSAFHKAALSSLLLTHMSVEARRIMHAALRSGERIDDPDERLRVARLLSDKTEEAAQLILETELEYLTSTRVQ